MKNSSGPVITEFAREDASKLADLFNSFDKEGLWPGGFTGGVPYTPERVLETFPVAIKHIAILVSTCEAKFTGICTLHPHYEDLEAAYIGVLGVHPDYLGKGHGKALILKALQIAAEKKIKRVDLDTWAGNLRAVPLYKKCGMFWIPETSVRMQDYVPGIINFPLANEFLKKHDWYSTQKRQLELVPDVLKLGEMDVFQYDFSENNDNLKVWVDRYGRSIMGVERVINDERFSIVAKLDNHQVIAGVEETLLVRIVNSTGERVNCSLFLSSFKELNFIGETQKSFTVNSGQSFEFRSRFVVNPQIEVPSIERKQKTVKVNAVIDGEMVPLEVGMRVLPPLTFTSEPESITISPKSEGKFQLNVFNNSKDTFSGSICLIDEREKLSLTEHVIPVEINKKSYVGFNVDLNVSDVSTASVIQLKVFAEGNIGNSTVKTKTETFHVKCVPLGGTVSYLGKVKDEKAIFIENRDIVASILLRGCRLEISYKNFASGIRKIWGRGGFGVGPPFGFTRPSLHDYEVAETLEGVQVSLSRMHQDKPGLKIIRTFTFFSGTTIIRDQIKVLNTNPRATYNLKVRIFGRSFLKFYPNVVIPLSTGIVEHENIGFPASEADLPTNPEDYAESWACMEDPLEKHCFGQVWSKKRLLKIRAQEDSTFHPEYFLGDISPGKSASTSPFYYICERGDWRTVRRNYKALVEGKMPLDEDAAAEKKLLFNVKLADAPLYESQQHERLLEIVNMRNKPVNGKIKINPPTNWSVKPEEIQVSQVKAGHPFTEKIVITPPPNVNLGVFSGSLTFSNPKREVNFPFDLLLIAKQNGRPVKVALKEEDEKEAYVLENGLLKLKASADFAGCLYYLGADSIVNQLGTSFPRVETKVFLENYTGGIRSFFLDDEFHFQKSKTHLESFEAEQVDESPWRGVKFSYKAEKQEELKGILGETTFFTLPSSNIVKIRRKFVNPTSASFKFNNCLWMSPNVGGEFRENEVIFPRANRTFHFKRAEGVAISPVHPKQGWLIITNKKKQQSLGLIVGNTDKSTIVSLDFGQTMLELLVISKVLLLPKATLQLEDYILYIPEEAESLEKYANILQNISVKE